MQGVVSEEPHPKDIVSFIFGSKGLIADANWEGSRCKKLDIK